MPEPLEPPNAQIGPLTIEQLIAAARSSPLLGCFVEVGVFQGGSAIHLHKLACDQGRELFLYDTFEGMPHFEPGLDSHPLGDFAACSASKVQDLCPYALVVPGIFPSSALDMPPIAFAHVDVDNYQSVKETAEYLRPRMMEGGVMWFDDSPCLAGAAKATLELFGERRELSATGQHYVRF